MGTDPEAYKRALYPPGVHRRADQEEDLPFLEVSPIVNPKSRLRKARPRPVKPQGEQTSGREEKHSRTRHDTN